MSNSDDLGGRNARRKDAVPTAAVHLSSGLVVAANQRFVGTLRLDPAAIPGLPLASLFADDRAGPARVLAVVGDKTFELWQGRGRLQRGDGSDLEARYWMRAMEGAPEPTAELTFIPIDGAGPPQQVGRDEAHVVIGTADHAWRVTHMSATSAGFPGWEPRSCIGSPLIAMFHPTDAPHVLDALARGQGSRGPTVVEARIGRRETGWQPAHVDLSPLCSHRPSRIAFALSPAPDAWTDLTPRRAEVFRRLAAGESVREIADAMFINTSTVRNHMAAIYERFDVHSHRELMLKLRSPRNP
jgi:DNA-binding CsgD family transcriptional regulator